MVCVKPPLLSGQARYRVWCTGLRTDPRDRTMCKWESYRTANDYHEATEKPCPWCGSLVAGRTS